MKTLHHLRTSTATRWALILVLWVVLVCLMKNMNVLAAACSVSASQQSSVTQDLASLIGATVENNAVENKAKPDNTSECHLSEKLLQFHLHQIDSVVITSLLPSLIIAAFLWFSLTSHRIFHQPPVPKRRRHLEFCTFQE